MTPHLIIIGIDDNSSPVFSAQLMEKIERGELFSGGARHYNIVKDLLPNGHKWINILPPMQSLFDQYKEHSEIIIFASGDPLFYGFAQTVQRMLPEARIETYPYFNSLQQLAHKMVLPYQNMHSVSLTGREWDKFDEALICGYSLIGVLTDRKNHTPQSIAQRMVDYGYTNYEITVGELLGNEEEKVTTLSLEEAVNGTFAYPNNLILNKLKSRKRHFGIADNLFELLDGRERMITKMPIRLATLSQLSLHDARTFWDVGFCTGSVSIEAKLQFPHLRVESFEIREGCDKIIEENMRRFGTPGIKYRIGDFTQTDIQSLGCTQPDAVFIGGHGGKLCEIMAKIKQNINPNGVVVFNSVSEKSYDEFIAASEKWGLRIENEISITVDAYNTITIIKGTF